MQDNLKEKAAIIGELYKEKGSHFGFLIVKLLDIYISEIREQNDTAELNLVPINQGKIEAFKKIKENIENGIPTF